MRVAWWVAAGVLAASAAQAVTPTSQARSVFADITWTSLSGGLHTNETEIAPDFGPFSETVDAWPVPLDAKAVQDSSIDPDALHATGSATALPGAGSVGVVVESFYGSAYHVSFDVATPTPFVLTGQLHVALDGCDAGTSGWIRLSGPQGVIAGVEQGFSDYVIPMNCPTGCQATLPISESGMLAAGSYTLEAHADAQGRDAAYPQDVCDGATATASYDAHLVLTQPQVPALPAAGVVLLAAALALAARARR